MNIKTQSKIMWTSGLTVCAGLASHYGFIPAKIEASLILLITTAVPAAIFVFRGWFTEAK
jgi:hypothetical protein